MLITVFIRELYNMKLRRIINNIMFNSILVNIAETVSVASVES